MARAKAIPGVRGRRSTCLTSGVARAASSRSSSRSSKRPKRSSFSLRPAPTSAKESTVPRRRAERRGQGQKASRRSAAMPARWRLAAGKTTVMGMLAAWSILNKVNDRSDGRFSDTVLVVCPNVTIRNRLGGLHPERGRGEPLPARATLCRRTSDGGPHARVASLSPTGTSSSRRPSRRGGTSSRVIKAGVRVRVEETITIGAKTTTARGSRYLTPEELERQVAAGLLKVLSEEERQSTEASSGYASKSYRYVESDTAVVNRVLGREVGGKQNILVFNDEAHHAYRIRQREHDDEGDFDDDEKRRVFQGSDGMGRWAGPDSQAARHQLLRRPVRDTLLSRARWAGDEPTLPVGRERLWPDRRDRVGADQDSAACRARHDRASRSRATSTSGTGF